MCIRDRLDVQMNYQDKGKKVSKHLVDNEQILIGRNDKDGYYFKFGIYRVGNSTKPVCCLLYTSRCV